MKQVGFTPNALRAEERDLLIEPLLSDRILSTFFVGC